jgi:hypothetical protein
MDEFYGLEANRYRSVRARVELAVDNGDGKHALTFPCQRTIGGWVNAKTKKQLYFVLPTHWRVWVA